MKSYYKPIGDSKQGFKLTIPARAKKSDLYKCTVNDDADIITIQKRDLVQLIESVGKRMEEQRAMNTGQRTIEVSGYQDAGEVFLIDYATFPAGSLLYVPVVTP